MDVREIKRLGICGAGAIGSQIAFQAAVHGIPVQVYEISDEAIEKAKVRTREIGGLYQTEVQIPPEEAELAYTRITYFTDLEHMVKDVDMIIEAVPEQLALKRNIFTELSRLAEPGVIFATNSSTFSPSQMVDVVDRPELFLAFHFMIMVWRNKVVDVMPGPQTAPEVFETVCRLGEAMGLTPLRLAKEQPGYIINSLLVPLLEGALDLAARDVASPEDIDRTWCAGTRAPAGPFRMMDVMNISTSYHTFKARLEQNPSERLEKIVAYLKSFVDSNRLGPSTGEGFYSYR